MATLDLGLTLALRPQQPDPFSTGLGKLVRINPIRSTSLSSPVPLYNSFEEGQRPFPLPQRSRAYDTAHLVSWSPALLFRERPQPQVPMLSSSEVKASQKFVKRSELFPIAFFALRRYYSAEGKNHRYQRPPLAHRDATTQKIPTQTVSNNPKEETELACRCRGRATCHVATSSTRALELFLWNFCIKHTSLEITMIVSTAKCEVCRTHLDLQSPIGMPIR